jgi:hypothetical protein
MIRTLLVTAVTFTLIACVPQQQWRKKPFYAPESPATNVEERFVIPPDLSANRIYSLAFVEFNNKGELDDKRQLDEALRAIDDADRRSNHRALVIAFVHGWKNNARETNNNVLDFRKQLNRIAADACENDLAHCGVVGVYLSWNGDLISRGFNTLRQMTYFDRRNTAARVASVPIGDALFAIMKHTKHGPERKPNHTVVVGHSFGGLILEYAIAKRMIDLGDELRAELGRNRTSDAVTLKVLDEFADLVVLINQAAPASEAVRLLTEYREDLRQVNLLRPARKQDCAASDTDQDCKTLTRPLILSVSSETDLATRTILPIAETLKPPPNHPKKLDPRVKEKLPKGLDEKKVFTTAAGHSSPLYSHELIECDKGDCKPCEKRDKFYIPIAITLPAYAPSNSTNVDQPVKYCLVRDFKAWNRTPYWIFHIPPKIVPDHGTIFTDRFTDFLTAFMPPLESFRVSQPVPPPPAMQQLRRAVSPGASLN